MSARATTRDPARYSVTEPISRYGVDAEASRSVSGAAHRIPTSISRGTGGGAAGNTEHTADLTNGTQILT